MVTSQLSLGVNYISDRQGSNNKISKIDIYTIPLTAYLNPFSNVNLCYNKKITDMLL